MSFLAQGPHRDNLLVMSRAVWLGEQKEKGGDQWLQSSEGKD